VLETCVQFGGVALGTGCGSYGNKGLSDLGVTRKALLVGSFEINWS
jgi:hypothetical protein